MKNYSKLIKLSHVAALASAFVIPMTLDAAWQLITYFSTETKEDINMWKRFPPKGVVYFDGVNPDDPTNRGFFVDTEEPDENRGNIVFTAFPVPNGGVGPNQQVSLKWDFYAYGPAHQGLIGLSDIPITVDPTFPVDFGRLLTPNDWGDYETVNRMATTFDVRDGNRYLISSLSVPIGSWMTVYQYVDNATDTYEVYVKRQGDAEPVQLIINGQSVFTFRNGTSDPLKTIIIAVSRGTGDETPDVLVFDNIYMDMTGRNPEIPSAIDPGKTHALGYRIENGLVDTENWLGELYAMQDPYFQHAELGWFYTYGDSFDADAGAWTYHYFGASAWEDWNTAAGAYVDTGDFMGRLYFTGTNYAYSASLTRWVYLVEPPAGSTGAYAFIGPYVGTTPPPEVDVVNYSIVSLPVAPTIDGVKVEGEWTAATQYPLTYDALVANGTGFSIIDRNAGSAQPTAQRAEAQVHVGATAQGIYFAFDVTDADLYTTSNFGVAGNGFDGVQVGLNANHEPALNDRTSTVLIDVNPPSTVGGTTNVYSRWATGTVGYSAAWGVQAASSVTEGGYYVELFVPWSFLNSFGVENPFTLGWPFKLTFAVMDFDPAAVQRELLIDSGTGSLTIGNPQTWLNAKITENLGR